MVKRSVEASSRNADRIDRAIAFIGALTDGSDGRFKILAMLMGDGMFPIEPVNYDLSGYN